jgi:hypothetical protein
MKGTSIPSKNDGTKSDEKYDEIFFIIFNSFWLGFQIYCNSLKSFISAPVRLIGKRALICDHSQFVNICLLFEKNICC